MHQHLFIKNICLMALLWVTATSVKAQGQDSNHQWVGNSLASVVGNSDADMQTVYLYNVGTGRFINAGSHWSTVTVGYSVGMGINIKASDTASGKYQMTGDTETTEGKYIAFGRRMDTPGPDDPINYNNVYVDRGSEHEGHTNGIIDWTFDEVTPGSNTYHIHCYNDETGEGMHGEIYLQLTSGTTETLLMNYPHSVDANDKNSQWKIVTRKDLKEAFKVTFASDEKPADATFLIEDQNFSRSHTAVGKWVTSGLKANPKPGTSYSYFPYNATYYVGMGSASSDSYQAKYAAYWIGNVFNVGDDAHANGTVTQKVTILNKGWYRLSCDGFYNPTNGSEMESYFFAQVEGTSEGISNVSAELNLFDQEFEYTKEELTKLYGKNDIAIESPFVKAAKLFNEGKYGNSLMVYVPHDNSVLNIGIEVTGSTEDLDWTTFDNFQLSYCGDRVIVLDEDQTDMEYIQKQVETNVAKTLILKRSMTAGIWNSITLPISLTAAQFKTAFGDQAKLSTLEGQNSSVPTRIDFRAVDLTDNDAVVMEPGKLYIMKPMRTATVTAGSHTQQIDGAASITVQAPYYIINNVTLATAPAAEFKELSKPTTTSDEKLQFCGTQIRQTAPHVPPYSYVLGAKNGLWHYTQNRLPIKGFRCWIATGNDAQAKALSIFVDGADCTEHTVTGIAATPQLSDVSATKQVYTLDGKHVATGAEALKHLPKGVYIVNRKKVIIK